MKKDRGKLALVLGGGGARGYAHIGVLKVLENELGFKPDLVVACSMGSIVGGFYSYGFSPSEMESLALQMDLTQTLRLLTPKPGISGLIDGKRPLEFFQKMLGKDTNIEELNIEYAAVAYDLIGRQELVFNRGNLTYAIRASISIPGVFPPLDFGNVILVDGGVIDPVPATAAKLLGADRIIAVNVLPRYGINLEVADMNKYLMSGNTPQNEEKRTLLKLLPDVKIDIKRKMQINAVVVGMTSIGVMEAGIIDLNLQRINPDVVIDVDVPIKSHEFYKARQAIDAGEEAALRQLENIKKLLPIV
nr:patatin-like phospholipase family protein [uncultured bacterium]